MDSEILSATLPKDPDIRDTLIAELRERFGERLIVLNGDVFALPEAESGNDIEIDEESAQILAGAGLRVEDGESIAFAGTSPEKRLSRAILSHPTRAVCRKSGIVMVSRRMSAGEFWIAAKKDGESRLIVFVGKPEE